MSRSMICGIAVVVAFAATAFAGNSRSAVSVNGSDSNPCTTAAPCRSFSAAIAVTNPGGEIIALDSAGYGPFFINQAITVTAAPGVHAAITTTAGNAIIVNAGASDDVTIGNLFLIGSGAEYGVLVYNARIVYVTNVAVSGFGSNGIRSYSAAVIDGCRIVSNNIGLQLYANAFVGHSLISGNYAGIEVTGSSHVAVSDSVIADNTSGIDAYSFTSGVTPAVHVDNCWIVGNLGGASTYGGNGGAATMALSNNTIFGNSGGLSGAFVTYGNNRVDGNVMDLEVGATLTLVTAR